MKPVPTCQTVEANVYGGLDLGYSGQHGSPTSGADSGAVGARERLGSARDSELNRLAELWPMLSELDRVALVDHAEHLVALRGGGEDVVGLDDGAATESRLPAFDRSGQTTARPVKGCGKRDAGERADTLVRPAAHDVGRSPGPWIHSATLIDTS